MSEPTQIPVAEEAEETQEDTSTLVQLSAPDPNNVNIQLTLRNVSPLQLWAMGRLLTQYGDQMYAAHQMQAMQRAAQEAAKAQEDALRAQAQDHKPKKRRAN